ncbi:hypothetical protein D3C80_1759700 [compost metagenome]
MSKTDNTKFTVIKTKPPMTTQAKRRATAASSLRLGLAKSTHNMNTKEGTERTIMIIRNPSTAKTSHIKRLEGLLIELRMSSGWPMAHKYLESSRRETRLASGVIHHLPSFSNLRNA